MVTERLNQELKEFQAEREAQKRRGLNDYNIMTAIRKAHAEVGMHSNFIYSLLHTEGSHYQGDLFAKLFLEHVLKMHDFGDIKSVHMEEDADGRRIDFTIKSESYSIGIEMKIYASDQPHQIIDYYRYLVKEGEKETEEERKKEVKIFYLTLDGKEPGANSIIDENGIKIDKECYQNISFKQDILAWLEKCQYEVQNITNLNNAIGYYIDVVRELTGQYQSPLNRYEDFLLNEVRYECYEKHQEEVLKGLQDVDEIKESFRFVKQKLFDDFYKQLTDTITTNNNLNFVKYIENSESARRVDGDVLLFNLLQYDLRLYFKENIFVSISVGKNEKYVKSLSQLDEVAYKEKLNKVPAYITGRKKGKPLFEKHVFLAPTIETLFFAQKNTIAPLHPNVIDEVQKHIKIITNALK